MGLSGGQGPGQPCMGGVACQVKPLVAHCKKMVGNSSFYVMYVCAVVLVFFFGDYYLGGVQGQRIAVWVSYDGVLAGRRTGWHW